MSITEQILARLRSEGTYSIATTPVLIAAMFFLPSDINASVFAIHTPRPYYKAIEASDSSIPACQIKDWRDIEKTIYRPRTALGKTLLALRNQAIAKGLPLLNADEILEEIRRRRGEID
jgi:hypothetical protein